MKIAEVTAELLRLPLPRPMLSGSSGGAGGKPVTHINMPILSVTTDSGHQGIGFAWNLMGGGGAAKTLLAEDIAPLLLGQDPLDHERLWRTIYRKLQSVGRAGSLSAIFVYGVALVLLFLSSAPVFAALLSLVWTPHSPTEIVSPPTRRCSLIE